MLFTAEPQAVVDALAQRTRGEILGFHFVHEQESTVRVVRPIQAWYLTGVTQVSSAQDKRIERNGDVDSNHSRVLVESAYGPGPDSGTGNLVPPENHSQFINVLIVADTGRLAGHEIGPISDYVAMLAMAQAQTLDACAKLPSILHLMAPGCPGRVAPDALTDSDLAFLTALYASDLSRTGAFARTAVSRQMAKDLSAPPKP